MSEEEEVDLEVVMEELGSWGSFQIEMFLYLTFPILIKAIYNTQYIFAAGLTDYRCTVPQCESKPPTFDTGSWGKFALPADCSDCYRKVAKGTTCEAGSFTDELEHCYCWIYENHYSIVYDFNLACQEWKRTLVGTMHSFAYFTALPAISFFSDLWGRGRVFIFTAIVPAFFGVGRAFVNNYYVYLLVEYCESFTGCGTYSTGFILGLEMVRSNDRVVAGAVLAGLFAFGQTFSGVIAYFVPYWRTYSIVIYTPSFIFFSYLCLYKESIRWLLSKGYKKQAVKIILKAARMNKKQLSPATMATLMKGLEDFPKTDVGTSKDDNVERTQSVPPRPKRKSLWKRVFQSKTMMVRIGICAYSWVTMNLVYYGLSINSVSLAGNKYANFSISSLIEIPGNIISLLTLDRYGRRNSICVAYFFCGVALFSTGLLNNGSVITMLTMFGKLCISMITCSVYIYTVELFPTEGRHTLLGLCSMLGRIGAMLAPQTPLLMETDKTLPNIIFGTMCGIAGLLSMLQPETLKTTLPNTVEQAVNIKTKPEEPPPSRRASVSSTRKASISRKASIPS